MKDPKSKIRWDKENVRQVAAKLFLTKEEDRQVWEFLQSQPAMAATIKAALREYMKTHPSAAQPAQEETEEFDLPIDY